MGASGWVSKKVSGLGNTEIASIQERVKSCLPSVPPPLSRKFEVRASSPEEGAVEFLLSP